MVVSDCFRARRQKAEGVRAWTVREDRSQFDEEEMFKV